MVMAGREKVHIHGSISSSRLQSLDASDFEAMVQITSTTTTVEDQLNHLSECSKQNCCELPFKLKTKKNNLQTRNIIINIYFAPHLQPISAGV